MRTLYTLVKPGGRVLVEGVTNSSQYGFGDEQHATFSYDITVAEQAFMGAGFCDVTVCNNPYLWSEDKESFIFYLSAAKADNL